MLNSPPPFLTFALSIAPQSFSCIAHSALVADLVGKLKVGDGLEAGITLGPMISK